MLLKNFYIHLNIDLKDQKAIDYRYTFNTKTRHICNLIERNCLKKIKFNSDLFQAIVIELRYGFDKKIMEVPPFISPNKSLVIIDTFDKKHYDAISTDEEYRVFIEEIIHRNLNKIKNHNLPTEQIFDSYESFKKNNFTNKWIILKKTDKARKLLVELYGEMKIDKFILTLRVLENHIEIFNNNIMETEADEYAYINEVKKLIIENLEIKILGMRDSVTCSVTY